ncbi:MAG: hypothetical protein Q9218_004392 [Villophora microphyllina]
MAEESLLSPPDPSKRRSTVSEWSGDAESHKSWTRSHDDEFALKLLRPWSIASHNSIRSRSSTLNDPQYAASSGLEPDDASSRGLLSSGTWKKFVRRSRDDSEDPNPGAQFAYNGPGWWKHQMLADRSFRTMAVATTLFAFIMVIICLVHLPELAHRANRTSTSVGGKANQTCESMEGKNVVIHLVINIAATMILGMSNTFQQLVTALSSSELRWVLSKHEDSRVGTNSPFNIKHKKERKTQAWLQWLLLIATSLPVHFLANSVIGPSIYFEAPHKIMYTSVLNLSDTQQSSYASSTKYGLAREEEPGDRACWVAFRTGHWTVSQSKMTTDDEITSAVTDWRADTVMVNYTDVCAPYKNQTTLDSIRGQEYNVTGKGWNATLFGIGDCGYARNVACDFNSSNDDGVAKKMCRLSVRMSAALILASCLTIKAVYMITIIITGRKKIKTKCLTFGDVIASSALDTSLQIRNECMVNAFDGHRHLVSHICHKHCRPGAEPSETGDSIGHCQKCIKFNESNKAGDLLHPSIAIKYKKSLIANLGGNAVTQMGILMICSCAMFGISLMLAVFFGSEAAYFKNQCRRPEKIDTSWVPRCQKGLTHYLKYSFGYFGGFDTAASLGSVNSEIAAFAISNGTQLLYSILYLLMIYNFTLITMEHDWGKFERMRDRLRCTIVAGDGFNQSYLLQLPKRVLYPMMGFSAMMHWLLGQAISTKETIWSDPNDPGHPFEASQYDIVYGAYSVWLSTIFMLAQTGICWWAFTYSREGFMPQMYGSIRACCAATTQLTSFPKQGIQWGDLGEGKKFRHAGFSAEEVEEIHPAELYCGIDGEEDDLRRLGKESRIEGDDGGVDAVDYGYIREFGSLGPPDRDIWAYGLALRIMAIENGFSHLDFSRLKDLDKLPLPEKLYETTYPVNITRICLFLTNVYGFYEFHLQNLEDRNL